MLLAVVLSGGIVLAGMLANGGTAQAAPGSTWRAASARPGPSSGSCRGWTRTIADKVQRYQNSSNAAIAGAFAGACFPVGGWPALACGVAGAVYGGFAIDQFVQARNTGACIRLRYIRPVASQQPQGVLIYVDRSSNCTN